MLKMSGISKASLLGEPAQIAFERALSEFRSGRPVLITSASDAITALPVDGMTEAMLVAFRLLSRPVQPFLLITARRARQHAAEVFEEGIRRNAGATMSLDTLGDQAEARTDAR